VKEGHWPELAAHCMWLVCWTSSLIVGCYLRDRRFARWAIQVCCEKYLRSQ